MKEKYNDWDEACEAQTISNMDYLTLFTDDMENLSTDCCNRHLDNLDFFLNFYLESYDYDGNGPYDFVEGIKWIDDYFGYFFIRKAMWANASTIQSNAASMRKFYKSMYKHNLLTKEQLDDAMTALRKENVEGWIKEYYRLERLMDEYY